MIPFSKIPLSRHSSNAFLKEFKLLLDDYFAEISWWDKDEKLEHWVAISKSNRRLLDILHTAIDGYILDTSNKAIKKVHNIKIHNKLKAHIKEELESYEVIRSMMAFRFIDHHYGSATDYALMLKLNAMNHGFMDAPQHMKKIIKSHKNYKSNIKNISDIVAIFGWYAFSQVETLYAKAVFPDYKFKRAKDLLDIPEHIEEATKLIIENGKKKTYLKNNSSVSPAQFERDWQEYRYLALKKYLLDLAKIKSEDEFKTSRIQRVARKINTRNGRKLVDATITFYPSQIASIKKAWSLKDNSKIGDVLVIKDLRSEHLNEELATQLATD